MDAALERTRGLKLMAFDVDGVLTDGALYLTDGGEEMKRFHTLDGLGLKLLAGAGIELALITGRSSRVVAKRAAELGIRHHRAGPSMAATAMMIRIPRPCASGVVRRKRPRTRSGPARSDRTASPGAEA